MRRDFILSLFLHLFLLSPLFIGRSKKPIEYPTILTVNLIPRIEAPTEAEKKEGIEMIEETRRVERKERKPAKKAEKRYVHKGMGITTEGGRYPSYYLEAIISKIGENWFNPYQRENIVLKATVFFKVNKDGEIIDPKIEKSSGRSDFDSYCLRAVLLTKRLPPIPEDMRFDELRIHLEFEHR